MTQLPDPASPETVGAEGDLARKSFALLIANVIGNAGFFVSALLIARSLGPAGRGLLAFFTVTVLVGSRFASVGMIDATSVAAAGHPDRRRAVLGNAAALSFLLGSLGAGLIVGFFVLIREKLPAGIDGEVLVLLAIGILLTTVGLVASGYLRGCAAFGPYARVFAIAPWLYSVGLIALWAGPGISARRAEIAWDVYSLIQTAWLLLAAWRVTGIGRPDRRLAREGLAFGVRAWPGGVASTLNARVDQVIMGFIATEATLGVYAVAVNVSEVLLYLPNAVGTALLPSIMRSPDDQLVPKALDVLRRLTLITLVMGIAAIAIGLPGIPLVFGHAFAESRLPFLLLLPGAVGYCFLTVAITALLALGAPQQSSLTMIVALVVGVVLDFALVPGFGANGASVAASGAFLAGGSVGLTLLHRKRPFPWRDALPGWNDASTVAQTVRSAVRPLASIRA